jgi:hypothetical protein
LDEFIPVLVLVVAVEIAKDTGRLSCADFGEITIEG